MIMLDKSNVYFILTVTNYFFSLHQFRIVFCRFELQYYASEYIYSHDPIFPKYGVYFYMLTLLQNKNLKDIRLNAPRLYFRYKQY